jgi:hypothetical protein
MRCSFVSLQVGQCLSMIMLLIKGRGRAQGIVPTMDERDCISAANAPYTWYDYILFAFLLTHMCFCKHNEYNEQATV